MMVCFFMRRDPVATASYFEPNLKNVFVTEQFPDMTLAVLYIRPVRRGSPTRC